MIVMERNSVKQNTELPHQRQAILLAKLQLLRALHPEVFKTGGDTFAAALSKHTQVILCLR